MHFGNMSDIIQELCWWANVTYVQAVTDILSEINYSTFTSWFFIFIWMSFILPVCLFLLLYLSAVFVIVYGHIYGLKEPSPSDETWNVAKYVISVCWHHFGRIWNGFEIEGLENIPSEGAGLIVYYHGACPVDMYYIVSDIYLFRKRVLRAVVDRFMFKIPGWEPMLNLCQAIPGSIESCTKILKDGHLMSIAPGGVYEAQFSDSNYKLLWRNRVGFAKVAIEAQAPIIPSFTINLREAYRTVSTGSNWFIKWYLKWRLPLIPIYGGYPVKLKTVFGKPIPYDPNVTPEELTKKTRVAIENLIKEYQRLPGSIVHALVDRIHCPKRKKEL